MGPSKRTSNKKALVADYASDVSSEDFSAPEDGECESDGGGTNTTKGRKVIPKTDLRPVIVANASPIYDDEEEDDFGPGKVDSIVFLND